MAASFEVKQISYLLRLLLGIEQDRQNSAQQQTGSRTYAIVDMGETYDLQTVTAIEVLDTPCQVDITFVNGKPWVNQDLPLGFTLQNTEIKSITADKGQLLLTLR